MTLLDSALGCSVHTTLDKGDTYTTLEIKVNLVRPLTKDTGLIRAEGRILHRGRTLGTAEGEIKDAGGKLYAHATTTCMIFPAKSIAQSGEVEAGSPQIARQLKELSACRWSTAWSAARPAAKPIDCPARWRWRFPPDRGG